MTKDNTLDYFDLNNCEYFDISPEISEKTAVFPGDTPFSQSVMMSFEKGHHLHLSSLQTTVHIGAHADAPHHYHANGQNMSDRGLHYYMGKCQVIHINIARNQRVRPDHLKNIQIKASRVLFKTGSYPDPQIWNSDFNSLSAELIHHLAKLKIITVGIDTPSIDLSDDKILESHQAIYEYDMAILEGLVLEHVPEGIYNLIALPLKLKEAEASPVRAILLK